MIPKIIHYCWFGKKRTTEQERKLQNTISNWMKTCPDYQIIEWNESNFDYSKNRFATEAYYAGKWAFVVDYARLKILNDHGGIYLDTDVELKQNFDAFLSLPAFLGYEEDRFLSMAVIGAEKNNPLINYLLTFYQQRRSFIFWNGTCRLQPNVQIATKMIAEKYKDFSRNNSYQDLHDCTIFPKDFFSPKDFNTKRLSITANTVAIHHFEGSWVNKENKRISFKYILYKFKLLKQRWQD